jgi:hypothetical protein
VTLNANIPLSSKPIGTANALFEATQAANSDKAAKQNRLLRDGQITAVQGQNQEAEQRRLQNSYVNAAIRTKAHLENNDTQGLEQYYTQRIEEINGRGGDPTQTMEALQKLRSGNIDDLVAGSDSVIQAAQQAGLLPGVGSESYSKNFQTALDDKGNLVFIRGTDRGGVNQVQGFVPVDPVQRKVDEQTAIQTQTPKGVAQTQTAEAKAKEQSEKINKAREVKENALRLVRELLADRESTLSNFGRLDQYKPDLAKGDSAVDASRKLNQLEDILTSDNLGIMTGVLSETDLQVIRNISAGGLDRAISDSQALENLRQLEEKFSKDIAESGSHQQPLTDEQLLKKYGIE